MEYLLILMKESINLAQACLFTIIGTYYMETKCLTSTGSLTPFLRFKYDAFYALAFYNALRFLLMSLYLFAGRLDAFPEMALQFYVHTFNLHDGTFFLVTWPIFLFFLAFHYVLFYKFDGVIWQKMYRFNVLSLEGLLVAEKVTTVGLLRKVWSLLTQKEVQLSREAVFAIIHLIHQVGYYGALLGW